MVAFLIAVIPFLAVGGLAHPAARAEAHNVQLINKCGSGSPVFLYQEDLTAQGSTTVDGPLKGGVAWVEGFAGANCAYSGAGCGTVEFTLINPGDDPANPDNSVNYSLQAENHQYTYPMSFEIQGSCAAQLNQPPCTGNSPEACPGGFTGMDTEDGNPGGCQSLNEGIVITFC